MAGQFPNSPIPLAAIVVGALSLAGCSAGPQHITVQREAAALLEDLDLGGLETPDDGELVYFFMRRTSDGELLDAQEYGEMTLDVWQRAARPWTYGHEASMYLEASTESYDVDGTVSQRYAVWETPNTPVVPKPEAAPAVRVDPRVIDELAAAEPTDFLRISVKLRDFPDWDVPLLPPIDMFGLEVHEIAAHERSAALAAREAMFETMAAGVTQEVAEMGGEVVARMWTSGWLGIEAPPELVEVLQARDELAILSWTHHDVAPLTENMGDTYLRAATDVETYRDYGYYGQDPVYGIPLLAAVVEDAHVDDEACMFSEGGDCEPDRLAQRFECTYLGCTAKSQSSYNWTTNTGHGTLVSSILAADYRAGIGSEPLSSICLLSPPSDWEERATGVAPEVNVHYYDTMATGSEFVHELAVTCAHGVGTGCTAADVINNSNRFDMNSCDVASSTALEDEFENAFDDGVLVVSGTGNEGSGVSSCNVGSPADTPKVFAVNGIDLRNSSYSSAPIHPDEATRGGGPVESPNGTNRPTAVSIVDLAAPSEGFVYATDGNGDKGCVDRDNSPEGTSMATPFVSGLGILLKNRALHNGNTWINNPGRLHTYMLLQGDRAKQGGGQRVSSADDYFGAGRAKLRLLKSGAPSASPGGLDQRTYTFTSSTSDKKYIAWGSPLPTGAKLLKCAFMQDEDMSSKDSFSYFRFRIRLRGEKAGGGCAVDQGTLYWTRTSTDRDNKKIVAYEDDAVNIEGRCVEIFIDKRNVGVAGIVTTHAFCAYYSEVDDEPN